ncbi:hypothetical protein NQ152_12880 [Microbacterium sp. zg.B48]|uniref:hypothetical protein n=1 Tax=unclassified Microbacterium TaxID=2609290 RepID=UPI00214B866E|nr:MULTISPECIES: hypothetical protein [unclassified Microbacterium]MCR2764399.1 hypothetical protein [Microbacterium sp. zg.B48]MCR2810998.1 hypothetical protein [Microbacterium sp. zg.B185]WIM19604.1 hypothetical protein QNO12_02010 [Microbacterium sp. zg-B185]
MKSADHQGQSGQTAASPRIEDAGSTAMDAAAGGVEEMTDEEKRRDQLLRAAGSTEEDAAPRIDVSKREGVTRIDIVPDAVVRPGSSD